MKVAQLLQMTVNGAFDAVGTNDGFEVNKHVLALLEHLSFAIAGHTEHPGVEAELVCVKRDEKMTIEMSKADWSIISNLAHLGNKLIEEYMEAKGAQRE